MKRFGVIILSAVVLTGCGSSYTAQIKKEIDQQMHMPEIDYTNYYITDKEKNKKLSDLIYKVTIDEEKGKKGYEDDLFTISAHSTSRKQGVISIGSKSVWDLPGSREELEKMDTNFKGDLNQLLNHEIINTLEETMVPGLKSFIQEVCSQTTNNRPQVKIIDNYAITVYPYQMYGQSYLNQGRELVEINVNTFEITDPYYNKLMQYVDKEQYIYGLPLIKQEEAIVEIATPAYLYDYLLWLDEEAKNVYAHPYICQQLALKDEAIKQARLIVGKFEDETIEDVYFDTFRNLMKNEWQFDQTQMSELNNLIEKCKAGDAKTVEGELGIYTYQYELVDTRHRNNQEEQKLMVLTLKKA